jgi:UDP-N-acetyl-D-mannosaminuronic acid dehydrogenase
LVFADVGLKVSIFDVDEKAVRTVNDRRTPFYEEGAYEILEDLSHESLLATTDPTVVSQAETVLVIIGTPVDSHLNPRHDDYAQFLQELSPRLRDGQLLVLRSTVYPGTTDRTAEVLARTGKDIDVSFCPERVAEGKAIEEIRELPQIVSGTTPRAVERASALFRLLNEDLVLLSPLEAELAKLFTNSWRYIQFATANQYYMMAEEQGLDFYKIYHAMKWKYPRTSGFPGAGFAAGPCLFKDTMQLASFSDNRFFLGHSAMLINEGLPNFLIKQLKKTEELESKVVGVLGMAFKGDIDDPRSSLSYKLKKVLGFNCKEVLCTDPYVADKTLIPLEEVVERADILVLGAPHTVYRNLDIPKDKTVVDVWDFW